MHTWDLQVAKEVAKLKGHMTACTCLSGDNGNGNMLITGSVDTNVKVWDLRMKTNQCTLTFKDH